MDLTAKASHALAGKSSRRQFFKFLGAGSLGAGLWLTGTDVALGAVSGCVGCGGGPCNPCVGIGPICTNMTPPFPCKTCAEGAGCPAGCSTSGEWFCCVTGTQCRQRCSECNCPSGCANTSCHCFNMTAVPCAPRKWSGDHPCDCSSMPPLEAGQRAWM